MKKALLIAVKDCNINKWFWVWSTPNEKDLTGLFATKNEAIANRPAGYIYCDDSHAKIVGLN